MNVPGDWSSFCSPTPACLLQHLPVPGGITKALGAPLGWQDTTSSCLLIPQHLALPPHHLALVGQCQQLGDESGVEPCVLFLKASAPMCFEFLWHLSPSLLI